MKSKRSPSSDIPLDESVVHFALEEFSRNGRGPDSELVDSILLATIDRKPASAAATPSFSTSNLLLGIGTVAAVLLVLIGVLSSLPYERNARNHSEIQFVVSVTPSSQEGTSNPLSDPRIPLEGVPYRGEVDVVVASSPSLPPKSQTESNSDTSSSEWTYPLPVALASSDSSGKEERVEIDSDSVSRESAHLVYSGNVQLRYRSFLISADTIRLRTEATASSSAFLTAENATFSSEEERDFPVIAASAGQLEIDPVSGLIRLQNVGSLETLENGKISIVDTQSVSISAKGYSIEKRRLP